MRIGQIKVQAILTIAALLTFSGRAENACVEGGPHYSSGTCLTQGSLTPGYGLTPSNIIVNVGQPISLPAAINLSITNGMSSNSVSFDCPDTPGYPGYNTNIVINYTFGDVYFVPPIPQVIWTPGTYSYTGMVVATGSPCSPLTNTLGTVTIIVTTNNPDVLLNVDFGGGSHSDKIGYAAIGDSGSDFWNYYSVTGAISGARSNLVTAEGQVSPVGLLVTNLPTAGTNGSSDAMYNDYLSTNSGVATVTVTNLPSGTWNVYLYADDGNFTLSAGGNSYGAQSCYDIPVSTPLAWQPGLQYIVFTNVIVTNGQALTVTVNPGETGTAIISGLQIASLSHTPLPSTLPLHGMVAWWKAEGNALDSIGTNNGTLQGGASFTNGAVGSTFYLNGTNAYVLIPESPSLRSLTTNITIEAWIKVNHFNSSPDWNGIVTKGNSSWQLRRYGNSSVIAFSTTGLSNTDLAGSRNINDGQWHHVAGVYDGTTKYIYVDGVLDASCSATGTIAQNSYPVCIGEISEFLGHLWNGWIDEASIYNRALSSNEIAAIYNAGSGGKDLVSIMDSDYDGVSDVQELVNRTDPNNPNSVLPKRLGYWHFDNTNTWVGDAGQFPLLTNNLIGVQSWSSNAVLVDSTSPAILTYRDVETNGNANINLRNGTVRFWFKPDWNSVDGSGTGPGNEGRLIEVGNRNLAFTNGWWALYFNTNGTQLSFGSSTNGAGTTNLSATISWTSNLWHQVVLTYTPTNSLLYLDGRLATNGAGSIYFPNTIERTNGFRIGSDVSGGNQARGIFEELETFNYPLNATNAVDSDGNGLPDFWELEYFGTLGVDLNADPDEDGRNNLQELQDGTDPLNPDSVQQVFLGHWRFDHTNTWVGDAGQLPIVTNNLIGVRSWNTNAVLIDNTNPTILCYRDVETNGDANISLRRGTIRFWFKPDWSSADLNGTGPQTMGRLVEVGNYSPDFTNGWWALYLSPDGQQLNFGSSTNGAFSTNFSATVSWAYKRWHQVVLTYSPTNAILYRDGAPIATNGTGQNYFPGLAERTNGFRIGSDTHGRNQAGGVFEDLETFNYQLSETDISDDYAAITLPTPPLSVTITSPTSSSTYLLASNQPLTITVDVSPGQTIQEVDYSYNFSIGGDPPIGVSPNDPFSFDWLNPNWTNAFVATYDITAFAVDSNGIASDPNTVSFVTVASDFDSDGIADWWTAKYFGHPIGEADDSSLAGDDPDGDGFSNLQEYQNGTNPKDYYNGFTPNLEIDSGDNQQGPVGAFLPLPLVVLATDGSMTPLTNAPIVFQTILGTAQFAANTNDEPKANLTINTDSNGLASVWVYFPTGGYHFPEITISAQARGNGYYQEVDSHQTMTELSPSQLGHWRFDTIDWVGEEGQIPLTFSNLASIPDWSNYALGVDTNLPALLAYRILEANGNANFLPWNGSVRFWFKPDWNSGTTNDGTGPGTLARLIETGSQNSADGWWALVLSPDGTKLSFITQTNGVGTTNLNATITWTSNDWHQVVLTYSASNSALYLDGQAVEAGGTGVSYHPENVMLTSGFFVGSDNQGNNQAGGQFDELETFNYQLSTNEVTYNYQSIFLLPPTVSLILTNGGTGCLIMLQQTQATEIASSATGLIYPNSISNLVTEDYADALLASSPGCYNSKTVGINISTLPPPVITPAGVYFNCPSNIVLSLGAENLTNMVAGLYLTELGRFGNSSELLTVIAYAQGLRDDGKSDESIRTNLINSSYFRDSAEYASEFGGPGEVYLANTNYTIEYSLDGGVTWSDYTTPIQITNSTTMLAMVKKTGSSDNRTRYCYLTSDFSEAQYDYIPASWLIEYFGIDYQSDPHAAPAADPDHDGLNNLQEFQAGTNPTNADTDGDGINDGVENAAGTDPLNGNVAPVSRLGYWRFNTTMWLGEEGQIPLTFSNLTSIPDWSDYSLGVDGFDPAYLAYRSVETNGNANIIVGNGSLRFWFKPDWNSSTTNGSGPGTLARLIEIGGQDSPDGWWALVLSTNGTVLSFITQTNSLGTTNLNATISWTSNDWHQVVLTYSATNSTLYLDGQAVVTNGAGVVYRPNTAALANGFYIGSDHNGTNQARGQFDELETFNYPLSAGLALTNYTTINPNGTGPVDYIEYLEGRNPQVHGAAVPDTNGVVNLQVYTPLH